MFPDEVMAPELITPEMPTAPSMLSVPESSALKVPAIIKSSLIVTAVESTDDISLTSKTFTLKVPETFRSSWTCTPVESDDAIISISPASTNSNAVAPALTLNT